MQRLADNRSIITDLDHAKVTMRDIALISKRIAIANARAEKRIADIKAQLDAENEGRRLALDQFQSDLAAWITANPQEFQKPRTVKTEFGQFGLRTVTELLVTSEDTAIQTVMERGYEDCFKTLHKLEKQAITHRLESGEPIPGCQLKTGDTVVCKVDRAIIDAALDGLEE